MQIARLALAFFASGLFLTPATVWGASKADTPALKIRLQSYVTSYRSKPGTPFQAIVVADYKEDSRVVIPRESLVYGTVRSATSVGLGLRHERARIALDFREYQTPDGQRFPFTGKLLGIENARERVMPDGQIRGILAAENPNGLLGGFWYKPDAGTFLVRSMLGLTGVSHQVFEALPMGTPGAGAILIVRCIIFRFPEPEIVLAPGTEMNIAVKSLPENAPRFPANVPAALPKSLSEVLEALNPEVTKANGQPADDVINLAFIGSRQQVIQAFSSAGWSSADRRSARSYSHEYFAFSSKSNYATAPVSKLLHQGLLPDFVFQKSLNTVSKRDHIRIWHYGIADGRELWIGAATHDSGITFRPASLAFSHTIDGALDVERSEVVDDLSFSGCTAGVSFLGRPSVSQVDSGGSVTTDGQLAVLSLERCKESPLLKTEETVVPPPPPGNKFTRITRRFILESRNYLFRENAYYWTYELIRYHGLGGQ